jgi:hypothetical protein
MTSNDSAPAAATRRSSNQPRTFVTECPATARIALLANSGSEAEEIRNAIFPPAGGFIPVIHAVNGLRFHIKLEPAS